MPKESLLGAYGLHTAPLSREGRAGFEFFSGKWLKWWGRWCGVFVIEKACLASRSETLPSICRRRKGDQVIYSALSWQASPAGKPVHKGHEPGDSTADRRQVEGRVDRVIVQPFFRDRRLATAHIGIQIMGLQITACSSPRFPETAQPSVSPDRKLSRVQSLFGRYKPGHVYR